MPRWLWSLFGQQKVVECEGRSLGVGPGYVPGGEGVFADVGTEDVMLYQTDVTHSTSGMGAEAAVLGMRILTIDEPLPMPVDMTMDARRAP